MPEKTITINIDGDPTLLNKKIESAAKNPVDLKITTDFDSKALMSGLNEIKSAASKISDSIGKDFSKIFKGVGKDKTPMQDALNEVKNNIASVITDIGTAENQLNAIRVSPGGDGFEELRANIDGIRTSIDGISKINLSALAPPDSAIQKLSEVRSQIESLSEVDKLESYLTRGANRYAKSGVLNNSYYENMKKYVDMGGKLSDISHKESGNLSNYLKEYTQMANAVTSTGKSVSFIDNNEISGAVEQLRQLRVEEQALSQTSGGLNLLGNIKQMTDSISQISALLHTEFGREPIKINVEPNTDDLKGKIQSSVDNESIKVKVEADTATLKDQINQLLQKDSALNIVNLGGSSSSKNPVARQRDYGIAARDAIPKLREQASELEKLFPSGRQSSQTTAVLSTLSSTGVTKDLWQTAQLQADATDKNLSLSQQMDALREYISLMQKAASIKGIDTSAVMQKFGDPEKIIQSVRDIQNGVKRGKNEDMINSVLQGNEKEIEANAGSIIERIQTQADGRSIAINVEPNVEGFVEKIQGAVEGSSIKIGVVDGGSNGKPSSSSSSEKLSEPGEGRGDMYRGQTALIRRQNVDLSGYNEQFQNLGLGDFKRLATFGEDGDAIITFMSGVGEAATETTIRVEDLVETVDKLKAGTFGHEDYKNEFSKADQDAIKEFNNEQKQIENQQKLARKEVLGNYKSGLNALATGERVIAPEEEKIIQNVQTSVRDITSSGKDMTKTQEEWANNVNKVSNEVYRNFADKQLKEMAKVPNEEYLKNIDGYANKRQEIVDMATKLKDTPIDFGTKEGMDFAQGMAESIRVAKTELEGMASEYDQIQARAKETAELNEKAEQTRINALVAKYDKMDSDRENMYKSLQRSDDRSDLANYKTGLKNQLLGIENNSEQIAALDKVRGKYDEITSSVQNLEGENLKYADSVRGIEEGIYRSVTNSISSDYNKLSESKYADRDEYKQRLADYKSFMDEINSKPIDFGNKSQVDNFRTIISLVQTLKSEMAGLNSEYAKQDAEASKAGKTQADALKQQQKTYSQQGKEIRKNLYEGLTGRAQKELTDAFSGKQFEKFGLFDSAKVNKDGSAVLSFVKEIDGSLQKVTVTAANANGALNALKMGRFEQYATDYQTGKITQSPEQKSDIKNYQSALIAEAKGMELTGIQTSALDKIRTEYQAIVGDIDNATNAQRAFVASVQEAGANATKAISDSLTKDYNKLASGAENMLPGYSEKLDELKGHIESINSMNIDWNDDKQKAELQEQISMVEQLKAEMTSGAYTPASEASINALKQRMSTIERYNTKAFKSSEYGGDLNALKERVGDMSFGKTSVLDAKQYNSEMSKLIANFQNGQKAGASFGDTWKQRMGSLTAYLTTFASFYRIVATIKQIANTVKELDSAMIELEKVSDVSGQRLQQSFETSKQTAQDLGATVTDVINATADWSRLGYSQDQAEELAKTAVIYEHVGDGINIDQANESLISTLQGFKMEASDAMEIVDKFNEVRCSWLTYLNCDINR